MEKKEDHTAEKENKAQVELRPGGPVVISGSFVFIDEDGKEESNLTRMAICRCGLSQKQPFCDGSHKGQG
jgi:CDGSH-type Zn-finger protein